MKIGVLLDSHIGEVFNVVPMLYYWADLGELEHSSVDVIYIGDSLSSEELRNCFSIFVGIFPFEISSIPLVSAKIPAVLKLYRLLKVAFKLHVRGPYELLIVPYDQKNIMYQIAKFVSRKMVAIPHTTGDEIYSDGVFLNRTLRTPKNFPVLVKTNRSKEYFAALGYSQQIVTGRYFEYPKYKNYLLKTANIDAYSNYCLFTLSSSTHQFSQKSWLKTHQTIFQSLKQVGVDSLAVKLHPSQDQNDYRLLEEISKSVGLCIEIISGDPIVVSEHFDFFINILTSAGQHSLSAGKPTCNFATEKMRNEVESFGNDPYPYASTNAEEISTEVLLIEWLKHCTATTTNGRVETVDLLSLRCLGRELS